MVDDILTAEIELKLLVYNFNKAVKKYERRIKKANEKQLVTVLHKRVISDSRKVRNE